MASSSPVSSVKAFLVTASSSEAPALARRLVEGQLCACVNILPQITSVYRWKGKVFDETESLLFIKTTPARTQALHEFLEREHSYDTPEILALDIDEASSSSAYLRWVVESTSDRS